MKQENIWKNKSHKENRMEDDQKDMKKKIKQEVFIGSSGSKLLLLSFLSGFPECLSSDFV